MADNKKSRTTGRAWELDLARGTAVTLMAAFHAVFDLNVYFNVDINYASGFWFYVGRFSAILFMFVSGISSGFSKSLIKRGMVVFGCGMIVTAASIPVMGDNYVRFGILHFFGAAMVLNGLMNRLITNATAKNVVLALMIPVSIILGMWFSTMATDIPLLLPIGIMTYGFTSFDYYPMFPWLAYYSAGALASSALYKKRKSIVGYNPEVYGKSLPRNAINRYIGALCFLGRNSLVVYLIHQPIILAIRYILFSMLKTFS